MIEQCDIDCAEAIAKYSCDEYGSAWQAGAAAIVATYRTEYVKELEAANNAAQAYIQTLEAKLGVGR